MCNIGVSVAASNRGGLATVMSTDSGTRGDILPFGGFAIVNIIDMAWFDGGGVSSKDTTPCEAATDASAKSKI